MLAAVLQGVFYLYSGLGDFSRTDAMLREQIELNHRLGDRGREANAMGNLGFSYLMIGLYYKEARVLIEKASQIGRTLGSHRLLAYFLMNLAEISLATGDLRMARQLAEQVQQEITITQEARSSIQEAWDYLKEHGWLGMEHPGRVYYICAETFDALGETENLLEVIQCGYRALMDVAEMINVPAWRQSFLENVPDNRALVDMWERRFTATGPSGWQPDPTDRAG